MKSSLKATQKEPKEELNKRSGHLNTGSWGTQLRSVQAMPYIKDIIGVGLARGIPNWKGGRASHTSFAPIFKKCKDMGLHLTAHAGMYTITNNKMTTLSSL